MESSTPVWAYVLSFRDEDMCCSYEPREAYMLWSQPQGHVWSQPRGTPLLVVASQHTILTLLVEDEARCDGPEILFSNVFFRATRLDGSTTIWIDYNFKLQIAPACMATPSLFLQKPHTSKENILLGSGASPLSDRLASGYQLDNYASVSFSEMRWNVPSEKNTNSNGTIPQLTSPVGARSVADITDVTPGAGSTRHSEVTRPSERETSSRDEPETAWDLFPRQLSMDQLEHQKNHRIEGKNERLKQELAEAFNGAIRMYSANTFNFSAGTPRAKTDLPVFGDPILSIETTEDGEWILATCKNYLVIIRSQNNVKPLGIWKSQKRLKLSHKN
ncbi:hypothetical protein PROFUN_14869 [Planoprotostelium fungivorum]|uniref:Vacuolar import/degradation Vid27 C-terminal domain-containing protein n=1 Tax=Planoprotostelium fungivorum TaxID=1890364 RepID=A0A2P6MSA2_9EUKA|nr:hypothetical protein PROFUN_14869 [Planoprotostelium fungivorum]